VKGWVIYVLLLLCSLKRQWREVDAEGPTTQLHSSHVVVLKQKQEIIHECQHFINLLH
jgi:hypothetical protein